MRDFGTRGDAAAPEALIFIISDEIVKDARTTVIE